jgi:hypothetical protein
LEKDMPRAIYVFLLLLFCGIVVLGQDSRSLPPVDYMQATHKSPSQRELAALLDRVSNLPAEYKADIGFAIIDAAAAGSLSPAQKRALLNDIFHHAASARHPTMIVYAAGNRHRDPLSHVEMSMLRMNRLDTLDIQTRVIERSLASMPQFTVHLFEEVKLAPTRASCKDPTVEDLSVFYALATKILNDKRISTISGQDKVRYLKALVSRTKAPAQIGPLANLITQVSLSPDQLQDVESIFVSSLSSITASDREMIAAEHDSGLTQAVGALSDKLTQSGISSSPLLMAYRAFLVRGLTQESCSDNSPDRGVIAMHFNTLLQRKAEQSFLSKAQLTPPLFGVAASDPLVLSNEPILAKIQRIRQTQSARLAEEYRSGKAGTLEPEPSDMVDVVNYAVSPNHFDYQCPACDFSEKGGIFTLLLFNLPPGSHLERAINAEVGYLSFNAMQKVDPVAWLAIFKELVNMSRKPNDEAKAYLPSAAKNGGGMTRWETPSQEAGEIRKSLRRSKDPIIATYMFADDLLHLPYLTLEQQAQAR